MNAGGIRAGRAPIVALLSANAVSQLGNVVAAVAIPWFVLQTTGSAARTGLVGFAIILPVVIAGLLGGVLVDRAGFKRMSVVSDIASGVTVMLIPLLYHTVGLPFWQLLVLVFLGGILDTPGRTARTSMMPDLVKLANMRLDRANSLNEGAGVGAGLIGPILAGLIIAAIGASHVLWLNAASFAFSAVAVVALVPSVSKPVDAGEISQPRGVLGNALEGVRFLLRDRLLAGMTVAVTLAIMVTRSISVVVAPVYADRVFDSAVNLGAMLAGIGAGAFAGIVGYGIASARISRRAFFVAGFGLGGLPLLLLATQPGVVVAVAAMAIFGIVLGPLNPLTTTVLQERIPEGLRGRVFGAYYSVTTAAAPLGMLVTGLVIEGAGLSPMLIVLAMLLLIPTAFVVVSPSFRAMDHPGADGPNTATGSGMGDV